MKSKFDLLVFDLDGTLTDSSHTIHKTALKTFEKLGLNVILPKAELDKKIGEHFKDIFDDLKIRVDDIENFIEVYKSIYFDFIDDTILYPNVISTLEKIKTNGNRISLLTTKAQDQAEDILEHFHLTKYFDLIMGRRKGFEHKPSPQPLLFIMNELKSEKEKTLMIGDSELDIRCGASAGSKTCGVTYGYRSEEKLQNEKPDYLINSIEKIIQIL